MTSLTDRIAEVLVEALETGLAHSNFVAIEGELDLDKLATYVAQQIVEELQLDKVRGRLRNAVARIYDNSGPSPVLGQIRRAIALLS